MTTVLDPQTEPWRHAPPQVAVVALVVEVLYVGRDTNMVRGIEAAGYGVEQARSLHEGRRLANTRRYHMIVAEADDLVVPWLIQQQGRDLHGVPIVIWEGGEVVSLQPRQEAQDHPGVPVTTVILGILGP